MRMVIKIEYYSHKRHNQVPICIKKNYTQVSLHLKFIVSCFTNLAIDLNFVSFRSGIIVES